jgi:hypothetical protein
MYGGNFGRLVPHRIPDDILTRLPRRQPNGGGGGGDGGGDGDGDGGGGAPADPALRNCASAHCSGADAEINELCKQLGWPVNHPVLTRDDQGPCLCTCSCLAFGTLVQVGDGSFRAIEEFVVGDQVLAADTSLNWAPKTVEFSAGTSGASRQKYTVLLTYQDRALAVTSDHLFLMRDWSLKRADRLTPGDVLVSPAGDPVAISSVHIGDYLAGFHHIATSKEAPGEDLSGHLLNTHGVISADYAVQLFARQDEVKGFSAGGADLPVIGSPEYIAQYGEACMKAPVLPAGFSGGARVETAQYDTRDLAGPVFVPAAATMVTIPDDAAR